MAKSSSTGAGAPDKCYSPSFQSETASLVDGVAHHVLVSASTQVQILSIVDETGSATIGEIVAELPDHPDPVGAVMVMVRLNILVLDLNGVLDANTIVRRAEPEPDPGWASGPIPYSGAGSKPAAPGISLSNGFPHLDAGQEALPERIAAVHMSGLAPSLLVGSGEDRRAFANISALQRPGVYILLSATRAYVGMGSDVGRRVARLARFELNVNIGSKDRP